MVYRVSLIRENSSPIITADAIPRITYTASRSRQGLRIPCGQETLACDSGREQSGLSHRYPPRGAAVRDFALNDDLVVIRLFAYSIKVVIP